MMDELHSLRKTDNKNSRKLRTNKHPKVKTQIYLGELEFQAKTSASSMGITILGLLGTQSAWNQLISVPRISKATLLCTLLHSFFNESVCKLLIQTSIETIQPKSFSVASMGIYKCYIGWNSHARDTKGH